MDLLNSGCRVDAAPGPERGQVAVQRPSVDHDCDGLPRAGQARGVRTVSLEDLGGQIGWRIGAGQRGFLHTKGGGHLARPQLGLQAIDAKERSGQADGHTGCRNGRGVFTLVRGHAREIHREHILELTDRATDKNRQVAGVFRRKGQPFGGEPGPHCREISGEGKVFRGHFRARDDLAAGDSRLQFGEVPHPECHLDLQRGGGFLCSQRGAYNPALRPRGATCLGSGGDLIDALGKAHPRRHVRGCPGGQCEEQERSENPGAWKLR